MERIAFEQLAELVDAIGAARQQVGAVPLQPLAMLLEAIERACVLLQSVALEAFAGTPERTRLTGDQLLLDLDHPARSQQQAFARDIDPLLALLDHLAWIAQPARETCEGEGGIAQRARHAGHGARAVVEHLGQQIGADGHRHFGSRRRRGRAAVGGEVDQGRVGLVAHGGDQRDRRAGGCAHHDLLVEGPQVFEAAAAARDDQHVRPGHRALHR